MRCQDTSRLTVALQMFAYTWVFTLRRREGKKSVCVFPACTNIDESLRVLPLIVDFGDYDYPE